MRDDQLQSHPGQSPFGNDMTLWGTPSLIQPDSVPALGHLQPPPTSHVLHQSGSQQMRQPPPPVQQPPPQQQQPGMIQIKGQWTDPGAVMPPAQPRAQVPPIPNLPCMCMCGLVVHRPILQSHLSCPTKGYLAI
eukprot:m.36973 g.36973  ORF g.36973 m.36973 type:complete len:134 (+) comp32309_c0_seq2:679-1080(+)